MNLAEFFDQVGAKEITEFIRLKQEEHLQLEFKTIKSPNLTDKGDKRNFAICLSGFANSSGGMIVWGVDARKNDQNVDCASAPAEIGSIKIFLSRLNQLTGEAVSPIVDGIRHRAIETTEDKGFVVTLVPESDGGPYRARLGEGRYYKRSGDSFYQMEHFDLEDMFGRRRKPQLAVLLEAKPVQGDKTLEDLVIKVINSGRAIAKHTGLWASLQNANINRSLMR